MGIFFSCDHKSRFHLISYQTDLQVAEYLPENCRVRHWSFNGIELTEIYDISNPFNYRLVHVNSGRNVYANLDYSGSFYAKEIEEVQEALTEFEHERMYMYLCR